MARRARSARMRWHRSPAISRPAAVGTGARRLGAACRRANTIGRATRVRLAGLILTEVTARTASLPGSATAMPAQPAEQRRHIHASRDPRSRTATRHRWSPANQDGTSTSRSCPIANNHGTSTAAGDRDSHTASEAGGAFTLAIAPLSPTTSARCQPRAIRLREIPGLPGGAQPVAVGCAGRPVWRSAVTRSAGAAYAVRTPLNSAARAWRATSSSTAGIPARTWAGTQSIGAPRGWPQARQAWPGRSAKLDDGLSSNREVGFRDQLDT
jgi:hypothetical protein